MIGTFSQMWAASQRDTFSPAIAGFCAVLWVAGSVSTLYGSLSPQWTMPHCPQSHSTTAHRTHGACAWHCDGIDSQSALGRSWRPSIGPTEFFFWHLSAISYTTILNGGITTRGPPWPASP
jgi:hypothetical protein